MPFIAAALPYIAAGAAAYGTLEAGAQAEKAGKEQKRMADFNADLAVRDAAQKLDVASAEESRHRKAGAAFKAEQRAGYAKAGVTLEGTPMDFLEETAIRLEGDALNIRQAGYVGYQDSMMEAQLQRWAGRTALARGRNQRRASYISAGGNAYGSYKMFGGGGGTQYGKSPLGGMTTATKRMSTSQRTSAATQSRF